MDEKERKRVIELLTDGLDILVGLDKNEEKKEEKQGEKPPDTFGGLLQSMIPLMILPQILPLFQQTLSQTLQSTTVNVKVESATSIIPIDISATTAIVPIEITASQVTLNVNIVSSQVVFNVNIASSSVILNVNVTNSTLNINITGQTLNISIINPTGIPLYVAQPVRLARQRAMGSSGRPANILLRSVTGRSRLLGVVIDVMTYDSWYALSENIINIIVDGVQNPLSFREIATWNGGLPFIKPPTAGSYIEAKFVSKLGGWLYAEETTAGYKILRLLIQLEMDSFSNLEIWLVVSGTGADVTYRIYTIVGFYP